MTKFSLAFVLAAVCIASQAYALEQPRIDIVQPPLVKIRVQDTGSRLLSQEEAAKLKIDDVVVAKPVDKPLVDPQQQQQQPEPVKPVEIQPAEKVVDTGAALPPIPLQFPQLPIPDFVKSILSSLPQFGGSEAASSDNTASTVNSDDADASLAQPQRKIISILLMKHLNPESEQQQQQPGASDDSSAVKSSFFIFRFMPRFTGNEESSVNNNNKPLLGGNTDPDMKMKQPAIHLLGGGGENDPDRMRFNMANKKVFTGNDDLLINKLNQNKPDDDDDDENDSDDDDDDDDEDKSSKPMSEIQPANAVSIFSIFDRVRNFLRSNQILSADEDSAAAGMPPKSIIIRTEDGQTALLPNEFGNYGPSGKPQGEENQKCLMLSFMRLKASMYYRTILHLLFFSGVLLFVLFMILLTVKSYKKRKYTTLRYYPHDMTVSTIDGAESKDVKSSKFAFLRTWSGSDNQLLTSGCVSPDAQSVLIHAPPTYDAPQHTTYPNKDVDTKSLPPDYEDEEKPPKA